MTTQTPKRPGEYKAGTLNVTVGPEVMAELRDFARRDGRTIKATITRAVRELIAREGKKI